MIQFIDLLIFDYYYKLVVREDQQNVDFSCDKIVNFVNFSLSCKKLVNFDKLHLSFMNFELDLKKDLLNL